MKTVGRLDNIVNFDFYKGSLVIQQDDKLIKLEESVVEEPISSFTVQENCLIVGSKQQIKLFTPNGNITIEGTFRITNGFLVDNFYINIGKVNKEQKALIIDLKNGIIDDFKYSPYYPHEILNSNRAFTFSQKIQFYNPFSGEIFWDRDIQKLLKNSETEIYGKPLIIEGKLFFFLFDSSRETNENTTFCLDIETGDILWQNTDFGGWLTTFENNIYSVKDKQIQILDPETFEVFNLDLQEQLSILDKEEYRPEDNMTWQKTFSFSYSTYVIENDHLYFTQQKGNTIGVINLKTEELLWHIDLEIDSGEIIPLFKDLKVYNDKLYVLDSGNTLHIFEKD